MISSWYRCLSLLQILSKAFLSLPILCILISEHSSARGERGEKDTKYVGNWYLMDKHGRTITKDDSNLQHSSLPMHEESRPIYSTLAHTKLQRIIPSIMHNYRHSQARRQTPAKSLLKLLHIMIVWKLRLFGIHSNEQNHVHVMPQSYNSG